MKKLIGKILSSFYDYRETKAFDMPFNTPWEQSACEKYINYNMPPDELKHIHTVAQAIASQELPNHFDYYFLKEFYIRIIEYKLQIK